jgi:regulator of protease activity HflC (stomatin/prohibitin superfamily)
MEHVMNKMKLAIVSGTTLAALAGIGLLLEGAIATNDANSIMVVQMPVVGTLNWYTTPGTQLSWWGRVTRYPKRDQFWFSSKSEQGQAHDESLRIRFNDGASATISGSISWEMPMDFEHLNRIHAKYGSPESVTKQLIRTVLEKAVYTAGPLMSSTESYAERKNELLADIQEQVDLGVFETVTMPQKIKDPMSGQDKTVNIVRVKLEGGKPKHTIESPLKEFGIITYNLSMNDIHYPDEVEKQISMQQQAIVGVSIAIAEAKKAEQAAITAAKQGEAEAAKAKWAQEVEKATAVTSAEKKRDVASLDVQTALNEKRAAILRGEGEAAARKLVMTADGALDKKLKTYEAVNALYADAIKGYSGSWVPTIVMGGGTGGGSAGSGANQLVDMLSAKTAHDLALDLTVPKTGKEEVKNAALSLKPASNTN